MNAQLFDALAIFVALLVVGAHAAVPMGLAGGAADRRALWARAAVPLLLALVVFVLLRVRLDPTPFVGAGLLPVGPAPVTTAALVGLGTLLLVDLFLALFHGRLEPMGWRVPGAVGGLALVAWSAFEEAARIGSGPPVDLQVYLSTVLLRAGLGLAAGVLVFTSPSPLRARTLGLGAAACAAALWFLAPFYVREGLLAAGDPLTLAAGALLVAAAPFVPERFRRLTAILGFALLALFLARAGAVSEQLGQSSRVPPPLPG